MSNKDSYGKEVRLAQYMASAHIEDVGDNSYRGLRIHALPGLHAYVADILSKHVPVPASVLELGAGSGALSMRMADIGYTVTATDAVLENFRPHDHIHFLQVDLDERFSDNFAEQFDVVVAVEIIEHLENPMHVFREVSRLVKPGGMFLMTTPNVNNPVSAALFCRFGHHLWFSERDRGFHGHISSLTTAELSNCAAETGFNVSELSTYGDPFQHLANWWKLRLLAKFIDTINTLPQTLRGEILAALMTKK